ncbi:MAG: DUF5686 family protein [Porphyromonadaceae bacterium]|nr:DUF5686 family protein [Porphyromonadaceae bacterium]
MKIFSLGCLLALLLYSSLSASAQIRLSGHVQDAQDGQSIPYASILIRETNSGSITDEDGAFSIELPEGIYHLEIRSLGYQAKQLEVKATRDSYPLEIRLKPSIVQLKEMEVRAKRGQEDPAYPIMRRLMYRVPIYRRAVKYYTLQAYSRTVASVHKIPRLLNVDLGNSKVKLQDLVGKTFVEEKLSRISFSSPDTVKQIVLSKRSSIPQALNDEMDFDANDAEEFLSSDIYSPSIQGILNPITPGAFGKYKYRLLSRTTQGDEVIYRISFRPRTNEESLVSGDLEVIEGAWAVRTMTLEIDQLGMMRQEVVYQLSQVKAGIYLPITFTSSAKLQALGADLSLKYVASMRYQSIEATQVGKLLESDSLSTRRLSNRDVDRHEKLLDEQYKRKRSAKGQRHRYERRLEEVEELHTSVKDSIDTRIDSAYWQRIRPIPMQREEQESFIKLDSINLNWEQKAQRRSSRIVIVSSDDNGEPQSKTSSSTPSLMGLASRLLFSGNLYQKNGWHLGTIGRGGLISHALYNYNIADQLQLGLQLSLDRDIDNQRRWSIRGGAYYTTRRRTLLWDAELRLLPLYKKNLDIRVGIGRMTKQIGNDSQASISQLLYNALAAITGKSYTALYEEQYINLSTSLIPIPALEVKTSASLRRSQGLDLSPVNTSSRWFANLGYWGGASWQGYEELQRVLPSTHRAEYIDLHAEVTWSTKPYHKRSESGWLSYYSDRRLAPIYRLETHTNIPIGVGGSAFSLAKGSMEHAIRLRRYVNDVLAYKLEVGGYLWRDWVSPESAYYFKTNNSMIVSPISATGFYTMRPYTALEGRFFATASVGYSSNRILLNYLPFFINRMTHEQLQVKFAYQQHQAPYVELGYLWGLKQSLRVGVYMGGAIKAHACTPALALAVQTSL